MANTAFNHDPALTVAASNTTAGAAVKWVASKNLGESLIILDSGGNGRIGLAGDLDLITLTSGTVTVAGTVSATLVGGAAVKDEDNMASDSATHLASQQSIKAYVDANGGPTEAADTDMENEGSSNANRYASPEILKHHPGIVKAHGHYTTVSTTALHTGSYNVSGVTDLDVGRTRISFTSGFTRGEDAWSAITYGGTYVSVANGGTGTLELRTYADNTTTQTDNSGVAFMRMGEF